MENMTFAYVASLMPLRDSMPPAAVQHVVRDLSRYTE
jgi:hypothetical protein